MKNPLCPYCRKELEDATVSELYTTEGCETCGWGSETYGVIEVYCSHCKKLVYKKEFR